MRALLSSCFALTLSQTSLASLTPDAAGEDLNLASSPSVPFLFGPQHALHAFELYKSKDYIGAVQGWQAALNDGYNFLLNDLEHIVPYTKALQYIGLEEKAYAAWEWFLKQPLTRIDPVWYMHYATCAVDTAHYAQTLNALNKYLELGGVEGPYTLFLAAQSHSHLKHTDEAVRAWQAYFCAEDPALIAVGCYLKAAGDFYSVNHEKLAAKYMTLGLNKADLKNITLPPDTVCLAARIYFLNKDAEKATELWARYFKMPDAEPSNREYASAGLAFDAYGAHEKARDFYEAYLAATPPENQLMPFLFRLGRIYACLGDIQKSTAYFERVLNAPNEHQNDLSGCPSSWFLCAMATYIVTNNTRDLLRMVALHDRLKPKASSLLNFTVKAPKGRTAPKKPAKFFAHDKVQAIHAHLRQVETNRCHDLKARLEKFTFVSFDQAQPFENERISHLKTLATLMGHMSSLSRPQTQATSSQDPEPMTILSIQRELSLLERACETLEKIFQAARRERAKQNSLIYLQSLGQNAHDLVSFVPSHRPNLRSLYGHAKPAPHTDAPTFVATSSSQAPETTPYSQPQVIFSHLTSMESDLVTLRQVRGLGAKYDLFMDEIRQDPFAQTLKSGKVKTLVGEKGLFSRRLDDGNRLVYRVDVQEDDRVHVCVLSVLGHYKHLKGKIAQTSVVTQKAPKTAHPKSKKSVTSKKKRK